jgi:hypothetical protein
MIHTQSRRKLQIRFVDAPLPEREPPGRKREELFTVLAGIEVGGAAVDVNRKLKSVQHYVYRFRVLRGRELRFLVRPVSEGVSRIWRIR